MQTVVVGHVTHDRYEEGLVAGGCAFYGAKVHAAMSGSTHLVTAFGDDFVCRDAIADLESTALCEGATTVFANYYPDDGPRIQLLEATAPQVTPGLVGESLLGADLVHLAPVCGEVDLSEWTAAVGDGLVAINVQGWLKHRGERVDPTRLEQMQARGVKDPASRVVEKPWEVTARQLAGVDVACLSEEDLVEQTDLLERLVEAVPVVALTRGARGSRIYVEGTPTDVGVVDTEVVDPTGAGDAFAAAFTHELAAGADPVRAARSGAAAASVVIEHLGSRGLGRLAATLEARQSRVRPPELTEQMPRG